MKAHKLAKLLLKGPNVKVIMQEDAAGNRYRPLCGVDPDVVYVAANSQHGEVYGTKHSADDNGLPEEAWEAIKKNPKRRCVVLHPV